MDGSALFEAVLDPGERLLWSGQPRKLILGVAGFNFAILTVGLGYIFGKLQRLQTAPLPFVLEMELVLVAFMLLAAGYLLGKRIFRGWITAYAVTDHRLLMALGAHRDRIRSMPLDELDAVKTEYRPRMGKVLSFRRRGYSKPWVWVIGDVEQARNLIETSRNAASSSAGNESSRSSTIVPGPATAVG
jgi:hypothetical protein